MALNSIVTQILSLFIVIALGFYGRKRKIIDEHITNGLSRILLDIALPLLIINSFNFTYTPSIANNILRATVYGIIIFIITPLIAKLFLVKVNKRKRNILQFIVIFSNCGFMGFPLADSLFHAEGVMYTSIFNMVFNIVAWTYGIMLFTDTKDLKEIKKVFKNPGIIATFIGLFLMLFSVPVPSVLTETMKMVGSLTTPLSMLIIGSLLATANFKNALKDITMYYGAFLRLIMIPVLIYLTAVIFHENSTIMKTFILLEAMPAGATASIFAENFNKEKEYAALIVSFTTLLSVITLPVIIKFLL